MKVYDRRQCSRLCVVLVTILLTFSYHIGYYFGSMRTTNFREFCFHHSTINGNLLVFDDSASYLHHYPEFTCPQNSRNMADWVINWPVLAFGEEIDEPKTFNQSIIPNLCEGSIIFVKTDHLQTFFSYYYPMLEKMLF